MELSITTNKEQSFLFPLKEIAKVSNDLLDKLSAVYKEKKKVPVIEEIDFSQCPSDCPLIHVEMDKKIHYCIHHCQIRKTKQPSVYVANEADKYIKTEKEIEVKNSFSKYQILLLLTYHFLGPDNRGIISYVSENELSKRLGCSLRTIRNNNQRLVSLGCISISRIIGDLINVQIIGYDKYHLSAKKGGNGYVQMTKEFFEELIQLKNVNAIRIALRSLLLHEKQVIVKNKEKAFCKYDDLRQKLPSHVNHKKIIDELFQKSAHMFQIESSSAYLFIKLRKEFDGKEQKPIKEAQFGHILSDYMAEKNQSVTSKEMDSLIDLSMEYGVDLVKEGLEQAIKYQINQNKALENLGGFVRKAIRDKIYAQILGYDEMLVKHLELMVA